jgi:hypothetical protein
MVARRAWRVCKVRGNSDSGLPLSLSVLERETSTQYVAAGLCTRCSHMRCITSDRGTLFYLCRLSATDASFPKYPRLPVIQCSGFENKRDE